MRRRWVLVLLPVVMLAGLISAAGLLIDLSGWWMVVEDNNHFIKMQQQGNDVTIFEGDGTFMADAVLSNDTLLVFISPTDTMIFVYSADTLRGLNEMGDPITLVKYIVDLTGWWRELESGKVLWMEQRNDTVTICEPDMVCYGDFLFANDTIFVPFPPPMEDTLFIVYAADTLRDLNEEGELEIMVRVPNGPFIPIHCGTMTVDGDTTDWSDEYLAAYDLINDGTGTPAAELEKLYLCRDLTYFYFRFDVVGDITFPPGDDWYARYGMGWGSNGSDNDYGFRIEWQAIFFRNNRTGEETTLEAPGVFGHTLEGRIPLSLMDSEIDQIGVGADYYDWDFGWIAYDNIKLLTMTIFCGCGDANSDMAINVGDAVYLVNYVFKGGPGPDPICLGDANGDGDTNVGDAVYLINYTFKGGPAPAEGCCP